MLSFLYQEKSVPHLFKNATALLILLMFSLNAFSQQTADNVDKKLFAIERADGAILVNWFWFDQEQETTDTTFNIYRDGILLNTSPIDNTIFVDHDGNVNSVYEVAPIVKGVIMPGQSTRVLDKTQHKMELPFDINGDSMATAEETIAEDIIRDDESGDVMLLEGDDGTIMGKPEGSAFLSPEWAFNTGSFEELLADDSGEIRACRVKLLYCRDPYYGLPSACYRGCSSQQAYRKAYRLCKKVCGRINCRLIVRRNCSW